MHLAYSWMLLDSYAAHSLNHITGQVASAGALLKFIADSLRATTKKLLSMYHKVLALQVGKLVNNVHQSLLRMLRTTWLGWAFLNNPTSCRHGGSGKIKIFCNMSYFNHQIKLVRRCLLLIIWSMIWWSRMWGYMHEAVQHEASATVYAKHLQQAAWSFVIPYKYKIVDTRS